MSSPSYSSSAPCPTSLSAVPATKKRRLNDDADITKRDIHDDNLIRQCLDLYDDNQESEALFWLYRSHLPPTGGCSANLEKDVASVRDTYEQYGLLPDYGVDDGDLGSPKQKI